MSENPYKKCSRQFHPEGDSVPLPAVVARYRRRPPCLPLSDCVGNPRARTIFGSIRDGTPIKNAVQSTFERGLCPRNSAVGGRQGGARREACDDRRKGGEA